MKLLPILINLLLGTLLVKQTQSLRAVQYNSTFPTIIQKYKHGVPKYTFILNDIKPLIVDAQIQPLDIDLQPIESTQFEDSCSITTSQATLNDWDRVEFGTNLIVQAVPILDWIYVVYRNLSISSYKVDVGKSEVGLMVGMELVGTYGPNNNVFSYSKGEIMYSTEKRILQIWTGQEIVEYIIQTDSGKISYSQKYLVPMNAGTNMWRTWIKSDGELYVVFQNDTASVYHYQIIVGGLNFISVMNFASYGTMNITDIDKQNNMLVVLDWTNGFGVYTIDTEVPSLKSTYEITLAEYIMIRGSMITVGRKELTGIKLFEFTRKVDLQYVYEENMLMQRLAQNVVQMVGDNTKAALLEPNILELYYHTIPEEIQADRTKLTSYTANIGAVGLYMQKNSEGITLLTTYGYDFVNVYVLEELPPKLECLEKDLDKVIAGSVTLRMLMKSMDCPEKAKVNDKNIHDYCIAIKDVKFVVEKEGTPWEFIALLVVVACVLAVMIAVLVIFRVRRKNQKLMGSIQKLKDMAIKNPELVPLKLLQELFDENEHVEKVPEPVFEEGHTLKKLKDDGSMSGRKWEEGSRDAESVDGRIDPRKKKE